MNIDRMYTSFGAVHIANVDDDDTQPAASITPTPPTVDNRTVRQVMAELEGCDPDALLWLDLPAPMVLARLWRKLYRGMDRHE